MPIHYFHCTDGRDLVLDRTGHRASRRQIELLAAFVASEIMKGASGPINWSEWLVSVQDEKGKLVAVVPFPARRS
jgi:hypothetical protein